MKKRLLFIAITVSILTGCPTMQRPSTQTGEDEYLTDLVEKPPKTVHSVSWTERISPLIDKLVVIPDLEPATSLLVNDVTNKTNAYVAVNNITVTVRQILQQKSHFILTTAEKTNEGKLALGIAADDNLASRSKAMGLARYLRAQYVLYTTLTGDPYNPTINMQLMLVTTGEIVWSDSEMPIVEESE